MGWPGGNDGVMSGGRCCSAGSQYVGPAVGGGRRYGAMKGDMEAPGFMVTAGPSTAGAVDTKEKG